MLDQTSLSPEFHLAMIMDGNGRWGKKNGQSRLDGHEAGMKRVDELFRTADELGVKHLSLFAFSTENWRRSKLEVNGLLRIFRRYIAEKGDELIDENVKVRFIGDKSAFPKDLRKAMLDLETRSAENHGLNAYIAMNYGGQDEILRAAQRLVAEGRDLNRDNFELALDTGGAPPVDLLIRTSGEKRLSNFMLWQCAYAELYFTDILWPDFGADELRVAFADFASRERRYGRECNGLVQKVT